MKAKNLVFTLAVILLSNIHPAQAQQAGKVDRVGYLRFGTGRPTTSPAYLELRQGLRELGYVEGQNLVLEYRSAEGKHERRPEMAAELVRLKVDVIVTAPAPPLIRAAHGATRTIPIVMSGIYVDPVEAGFVASLARPGGNITGMTNLESDLHPKRLELLKELFPQISRVAILWPPYQQKRGMKEIETAGEALGIQIQSLVRRGRRLGDLESAFTAISQEPPDALLVASSALTLAHQARIIEFTAEKRLPTIFTHSQFVDAGGLMSYGADFLHLYRRAATYVDKILKGANPAELPIEQPREFELVINLKTAEQIGVTIPPTVLYQATKVIK